MPRVQETTHTDVFLDPCWCIGVASSRLTSSDPTRIPAEPFSYARPTCLHTQSLLLCPCTVTILRSHPHAPLLSILCQPIHTVRTTTLASAHTWEIGTTKKRRASISSSRVPSPHMGTPIHRRSSINKGRYEYLPMMQEYLRYRRSTVDFNPGLP